MTDAGMSTNRAVSAVVSSDGRILTVRDVRSGLSDRFHGIWLRDACSCALCRRPTTGERLLDPITIDPDLTILEAGVDGGDQVSLVFSDGHRTTISTRFLLDHSPSRLDHRRYPMVDRAVWDGRPPAAFDRADCNDEAVLRALVNAVWDRGTAIVRSVEPTEEGLLSTAALIGHVLPSNYGFTWSIDATVTPVSEVDSEHGLRVHTDLPYRRTPPGLQLILAAVPDVAGGASTLADGFSMAELLRADDPAAWQLLTTVPFVYPYDRPGVRLHGSSPLISLHHDGSYRDVRHGRTAFELGASGRRRLLGCYLDIDELANRRAVLNATVPVEGSATTDGNRR
ncbi:MAG: TauD/TfdA family dioxygenase [Acidimicrobiia bacterium]|nr:TauD/TfdA family dioxygenase [Acidimicrobiia bacterium]